MKKNKLLICFKPFAVEEDADDPSAVDRNRSVFPIRKSKSCTFAEFPDENSMITRRKKEIISRSISGSFEAAVLALSFRKHSNGKVHVHGTTDLRRNRLASKSSRFYSERNRRWNPRIKESSSEASLTLGSKLSDPEEEEEEKQSIENSEEKKNRVESDSRSKWWVYLILVISLFMTVFYGRVYSVVVTSSFIFCLLCHRRRRGIEDIAGGGGGGGGSESVEREMSHNIGRRCFDVGNPPKGISINDVNNFYLRTKSLSRASS